MWRNKEMNIDLTEWVLPIVAVAVYVVCEIVKRTNVLDNNKYIPLIAGVLGVLFSFWANHALTFEIFAQGLVSGFSATGIDQVYKQLTKGE